MHANGKLPPHPEDTHPRVKLVNHLLLPATEVPAVVDYAAKVASWPMYGNNDIGDCTCAGVGHMIQAWTAYAGSEVTLPDADILALYEKLSGYNPATGANDNGCVEQDVLQDLVDTGIDGHKVLAFAQVNIKDPAEMKAALQIFGSLYLGIQCPQSAQQQYADGQPWDYVPGSPVEGGHCVVMQKWDEKYMYIVSWGELIPMTSAFWSNYGDEAWVVVTQDFIEKSGLNPDGLSLQTMLSEFHEITGSPVPSPRHAAPQPSLFQRAWNWLRHLI